MTVIAIGLNHRSAPLGVLEQMTLSADDVPKALAEITSSPVVNEAVLLSTCNRTEVYVHAERFHDAYRDVREALAVMVGLDSSVFVDHLYVHFDGDAIDHLFSVSAGLDSAVLGEHEILGQIRGAWERARLEGTSGSLLNPVFEHAVTAGKRVRTETAIGRRTASISHAAVSLVTERLGDLTGKRVLLVGAGEVGAGVAGALAKTGAADVTVTNRTASRAVEVAKPIGAAVVPFESLAEAVAASDVIVSATGAAGVVLDADTIKAAIAGSDRRLLILDLAVPRDVDAAVIAFDRVDLLVLSDLQAFANRGLEERQKEVVAARNVMEDQIEQFRRSASAVEVDPVLGSLHRWADTIRHDEIERFDKHLGDLTPEQAEAIDALTKAVVKKLLHPPSSRLKDASGSRRGDRLVESVRELFDLS
mgnify:CR=1 FL=1